LVELAEPGHYYEKWKNWALDALPIFPQQYDFQVAADKKKQFKIVSGVNAPKKAKKVGNKA